MVDSVTKTYNKPEKSRIRPDDWKTNESIHGRVVGIMQVFDKFMERNMVMWLS